jgi:hypothetical protein
MCRYGPGQCDPPDDLNADGSGTDQHWKDFVTAVAIHVNGQVGNWEVWNEPQSANSWNGTYAQMVRMAQDARAIIQSFIPDAKMLNGGVELHQGISAKWWKGYAAAGGLDAADLIAIHGDVRTYPEVCGVYPQAENFIPLLKGLKKVLSQYGQNHKPIFDTEASWGHIDRDCFTDPDLQSAFLARFYLIHLSQGIQRYYWRGWTDDGDSLYDPATGLTPAGVAYLQIHGWLFGNTLTGSCTATGTTWTCNFTGPNGYVAEAIWDTSQTCQDGQCGTIPYTVDAEFLDYLTIAGDKIQISNNTVPLGAKPIWVENQ